MDISTIIIAVAAFVSGWVVRWIFSRIKTLGTVHVNTSNPKKDVYTFEFNDLKDLETKRFVTLKVDRKMNTNYNRR